MKMFGGSQSEQRAGGNYGEADVHYPIIVLRPISASPKKAKTCTHIDFLLSKIRGRGSRPGLAGGERAV